jgi:hypothetical protein
MDVELPVLLRRFREVRPEDSDVCGHGNCLTLDRASSAASGVIRSGGFRA